MMASPRDTRAPARPVPAVVSPTGRRRARHLGAAALAGLSIFGAVSGVAPYLMAALHPLPASLQQTQSDGARAAETWGAVQSNLAPPYAPTHLIDGVGRFNRASIWAYGQAMEGALDNAKLSGNYTQFNALVDHLGSYRSDGHFGPYYDDNAWIGLVLMQAHQQNPNPADQAKYLAQAQQVFDFIQHGTRIDGAITWVQDGDSVNTCATAPAVELALQLQLATPHPHDLDTPYYQFATQQWQVLQHDLKMPNGLYRDHIGGTQLSAPASIDDDVVSYNQGTPIGAGVLFYRITGDPGYLVDAQRTATASLDYFGQGDNLWSESPAFNAIYFRNMQNLAATLEEPAVRAQLGTDPTPLVQRMKDMLASYTDRAWKVARNPSSGLFDPSRVYATMPGVPTTPIGQYFGDNGRPATLDEGGMTQLYAMQAWPEQAWTQLS
jgi:hypothetical protein